MTFEEIETAALVYPGVSVLDFADRPGLHAEVRVQTGPVVDHCSVFEIFRLPMGMPPYGVWRVQCVPGWDFNDPHKMLRALRDYALAQDAERRLEA